MINRKFSLWLIFVLLTGCNINSGAQDIALKTNLLYDATATVNLGAELGIAPKWSFDLSGNIACYIENIGETHDELAL